jgi:hypothetical protein
VRIAGQGVAVLREDIGSVGWIAPVLRANGIVMHEDEERQHSSSGSGRKRSQNMADSRRRSVSISMRRRKRQSRTCTTGMNSFSTSSVSGALRSLSATKSRTSGMKSSTPVKNWLGPELKKA